MKVALICNNRLALPALDLLISNKLLVAVGASRLNAAILPVIAMRCKAAGIPLNYFSAGKLEEELTGWLEKFNPDVVLVKTFPYLIPESVLGVPRFGFINFHYAPLPQWRGRDPLFWMLRNGETSGGVTAHQMTGSFDQGPILSEIPLQISADVTHGLLNTQLAYLGLQLTINVVEGLAQQTLVPREQDHKLAGWYDQPQPKDLFIDWKTMPSESVLNMVRACNPWNKGAATAFGGWTFGITHASLLDLPVLAEAEPGTILALDAGSGLVISCLGGTTILVNVIYCEEGYYPGYCLAGFGLNVNDRLD